MASILLIEDNPGDAIIFREKLAETGSDHQLVHVLRLDDGLDALARKSFDLIMVDLSLPDARGLEVVGAVQERAPATPVIVVTGLDDAGMAAAAKQAGAVDYLVKWYVDAPSLDRYIRYATAHQTQVAAADDLREPEPAPSPQRPAPAARPEPSRPAPARPEPARAETPRNGSADRSAPADADAPRAAVVAQAMEQAGLALAVLEPEGGAVLWANASARRLMESVGEGDWSLHEGRQQVEHAGGAIQADSSLTSWDGRAALLTTLRLAEASAPRNAAPDTESDHAVVEATLAFASQVEDDAAHLGGLLRTALQMEEGFTQKPEPVDALELVNTAVAQLRPIALRRGLPIRVRCERKKAAAYASPTPLGRLIYRLLSDALTEAASDGVQVTVEILGQHTAVRLAWTAYDGFSPAAPARLGRHLSERLATQLGHPLERQQNGRRRTVTIKLPAPA